jgi:hypothetical protein
MQRHMHGLGGERDRALLFVGFFGALRRSEIAKNYRTLNSAEEDWLCTYGRARRIRNA